VHQHACEQRAGPPAHTVAAPRQRVRVDRDHLDRSAVRQLQRLAGNGAIATLLVQRQPAPPRDPKHPENFATYGEWLESFGTLPTFDSNDQVKYGPDTKPVTVGSAASHKVLGDEKTGKATKPKKGTSIPVGERAPTPIGREAGDAFIDHPTDQWVRDNLPEELRQTAYRLPANCADVAIVLRHVWLFAHQRSETFKGFRVGVGAGRESAGARIGRVGRAIAGISTANVSSMVNPYLDDDGRPIRSLARLGPMLHPGDVLVWEHHAPRPATRKPRPTDPRTGGHTHTIVSVERTGGTITTITALQGNQPLPKDTGEKYRYTPGRRIEKGILQSGDESVDSLRDTEVTIGGRTEQIWVWADKHTTLVVAGPPRAANRPKPGKEGGKVTPHLADWLPVIARANRAALTGTVEASMREALSMLERGVPLPEVEGEARSLGRAAGERLAALDADLAKRARPPDPAAHEAITAFLRALQTGASSQAGAAKSLFTAVLEAFEGRSVEAGWSGVGPASVNAGERVVGHVRRIPIDDLPGDTPRAIVAVPASMVGGTTAVDVLLHFHGWGPGFTKGRDITMDRVEAQLEATKRRMVAILPQGGTRSEFGSFEPDKYVGAVFTQLNLLGAWGKQGQPPRGQIVVTGHSGGGKAAMDLVAGGAPGLGKGKLAEVALFDGINGPDELDVATRWVTAQLDAALVRLQSSKGKQAEEAILATVIKFRAYHSGSATAKASRKIRDWPGLHASLRAAIDAWFAGNGPKLSPFAVQGLRDRIQVIATGQRVHEKMVGGQSGPGSATGTLQDALSR
jgi:hypothetical protein